MKNIIGITGTNGAGKGTVVEILKNNGFKHYSAYDLLMEEVISLGMPQNRDSLIFVGNKLRKQFGPGYVAEKLIEKAKSDGGKAIVESIRTVGEIEVLKQAGGILLAIDADQKIRYERIKKRGGVKDNVTWQEFIDQENKELASTDPNVQNLSACRNLADLIINNNGSLADLEVQVSDVLKNHE